MSYQINKDQYAKLQAARKNWPERLSFFSRDGDKRCVLSYLSNLVGLDESAVIIDGLTKGSESIDSSGLRKLSKVYGLPNEALKQLYHENNRKQGFLGAVKGTVKRSKRVLREFDLLLEQIDVQETPEQKAIRTLDGFLQHINSSNRLAELETV